MRYIAASVACVLPAIAWIVVENYSVKIPEKVLVNGEPKVATLKNFQGHDVTPKGEEFFLSGETLEHFQSHDRFYGTHLERKNIELVEHLSSVKGSYEKGVYTLVGDVNYTRSDGYVLRSDRVLIDKQTGRVIGPSPFVVTKSDTLRINGAKFLVHEHTKKLECDTIKAEILIEQKGS